MAKDSIFDYLKSYIPTDKREAREDYLTQLFAWLLQNVDNLGFKYCEYLLLKMPKSSYKIQPSDSIEVDTQVTVAAGRIDLVIKVNDTFGFICEHKVNANLSKDQIKKYMNSQAQIGNHTFYSVLITLGKHQHTQKADVMIVWSEIYEFLEDSQKDYSPDNIGYFMIQQTLDFMKNNNLGKTEPITPEAVAGYWSTVELKENVNRMLKNLNDKEWEKDCPELNKVNKKGVVKKSYKDRWGRSGFDMFEEWSPGVFAGILWDVRDHRIEPMSDIEGPEVLIIIDLPSISYSQVVNSKKAQDYFSMLKSNKEEFDLLTFSEIKNNWRFAVLRKSLAEVLKGTSTGQEQSEALYKTLTEGINIMVSNGELGKLPW